MTKKQKKKAKQQKKKIQRLLFKSWFITAKRLELQMALGDTLEQSLSKTETSIALYEKYSRKAKFMEIIKNGHVLHRAYWQSTWQTKALQKDSCNPAVFNKLMDQMLSDTNSKENATETPARFNFSVYENGLTPNATAKASNGQE